MERLAPPPTQTEVRASVLALLDAALDELEELPRLDEARFLATHVLFEGCSDQRDRITQELCERVDLREPVVRSRRVLGVGCGGGDIDVPLARTMAAGTDELVYVGVDPSEAECAAIARLFAEADLPGVSLELAVETFEEFETTHSFDVIHFVHSLYYMNDPARALARARELLAPDGQLIVLQAPREELNELAVRFYDKQYQRPTLFAEDLARLLERWGWDFDRTRLDARVDVTPLMGGDREIGSALRDFIVQVDGRRLPPAVQELIERYLRSIAIGLEGREFISHPVDAFFIGG